jgi:ribosomal protein S18 acetylase RimI-like enzyme
MSISRDDVSIANRPDEFPGNVMIRRMQGENIPRVVEIHLQSFPGYFLTFLGARFLSLYYAGICTAREGIAFIYVDATGSPAGFVAGTLDPRGFYSRLLRRDWIRFSLASLAAIVRKPSIVPRVARGLFHPSRNPGGKGIAGLYSIGVLPSLQGTGAGRKLVAAFLEEARSRGCGSVFLTTDRDGNDAVNVLYRKLGFRVERDFMTPEGRWMNEYWIEL